MKKQDERLTEHAEAVRMLEELKQLRLERFELRNKLAKLYELSDILLDLEQELHCVTELRKTQELVEEAIQSQKDKIENAEE